MKEKCQKLLKVFALLWQCWMLRTRAAGPYKVETASENPGASPGDGGAGGSRNLEEAPRFSEAVSTLYGPAACVLFKRSSMHAGSVGFGVVGKIQGLGGVGGWGVPPQSLGIPTTPKPTELVCRRGLLITAR